MSVSPFPTVVTRAWRCLLLLFCLLAAAGCAARGRSAAVPTATFTAPPAPVRFLAVPTFTPTPTLTPTLTATLAATALLTPPLATPVAGVYANPDEHHAGNYRLQRQGDRVEATFMTTRSPVQAGTQLPPPVLKDDPAALSRASRDASAIVQYLRPPVAGLPTYGITQPRSRGSADGNENENLLIPAPSSRGLLILPGQCVM